MPVLKEHTGLDSQRWRLEPGQPVQRRARRRSPTIICARVSASAVRGMGALEREPRHQGRHQRQRAGR